MLQKLYSLLIKLIPDDNYLGMVPNVSISEWLSGSHECLYCWKPRATYNGLVKGIVFIILLLLSESSSLPIVEGVPSHGYWVW